ncbi:MAG: FHA domain-containing protein [Lachnospiraceae bacterium]|nr:FHA domain-containing protein [Lachnospiraceae bacterium]
MKKRAGKRIRAFTAAVCMILLAAVVHITAFAGQEDKAFVVIGYDADGESVSIGLGYYVQMSGEYYLLSDISAYDEDVTEYYAYEADSSSSGYEVEPEGQYVGSMLLFEFADDTPPSSYLVSLGDAAENQTVNWVFITSEAEIDSVEIQLTSAEEVEMDDDTMVVLHGNTLEDVPEDMYAGCLPMALIDDNGTLVGLYTSSDYFCSFLDDAASFGAGTADSGGSSDTEDGDDGTADSDDGGTSRVGRDEPESDFPVMLIVVVVIIAAAAAVILFVYFTKKKKPAEHPSSSDESAPGTEPQINPAPYVNPQEFTETAPPGSDGGDTMMLDPWDAPGQGGPIQRQMSITGIAGAMMGRTYPAGPSVVTMGRDVSAVIRFAPDTKGISREHCRLFRDGQGNLMLMDCGSSYGTFLTGYGKLQPQKPVPVKDGDKFYLGSDANGFMVHIQ